MMDYVPSIKTVDYKDEEHTYFHYSTLQEVLKHYKFNYTDKTTCHTYEKIRLLKPL
jgi:hypothetical protein